MLESVREFKADVTFTSSTFFSVGGRGGNFGHRASDQCDSFSSSARDGKSHSVL